MVNLESYISLVTVVGGPLSPVNMVAMMSLLNLTIQASFIMYASAWKPQGCHNQIPMSCPAMTFFGSQITSVLAYVASHAVCSQVRQQLRNMFHTTPACMQTNDDQQYLSVGR